MIFATIWENNPSHAPTMENNMRIVTILTKPSSQRWRRRYDHWQQRLHYPPCTARLSCDRHQDYRNRFWFILFSMYLLCLICKQFLILILLHMFVPMVNTLVRCVCDFWHERTSNVLTLIEQYYITDGYETYCYTYYLLMHLDKYILYLQNNTS